jgi:hypothetical protein
MVVLNPLADEWMVEEIAEVGVVGVFIKLQGLDILEVASIRR